MGVDQTGQRVAHGFRFGGVDAEPGTAGLGLKVEHVEAAASSGNDSGQTAGIAAVGMARLRNVVACGAIEQFQTALDCVGGIARFDGLGVSGVDEDQPTGRIAQPHRRRQLFDQRTHRCDLALQRFVAFGEVEKITLHTARIFEPQHRASGDGTALSLDRAAGHSRERHRERLAARAQRLDRPLHGARLARIEPGAEGQDAMRGGNADHGWIAFDERLIGGGGPVHHHLRFRGEQSVGAVKIGPQRRNLVVR